MSDSPDDRLMSALRRSSRPDALRARDDGADVERLDDRGESLLKMAIDGGDVQTVGILLSCGADANRVEPPSPGIEERFRTSPLHAAVSNACVYASESPTLTAPRPALDIVSLLLDAGGDPDRPMPDGTSPVEVASSYVGSGGEEILGLLRRNQA